MKATQGNQATTEATRASKQEKEETTQRNNWYNEQELRETQQEDPKPDPLKRYIEERADAEDKTGTKQQAPKPNKTTKGGNNNNHNPREKRKTRDEC